MSYRKEEKKSMQRKIIEISKFFNKIGFSFDDQHYFQLLFLNFISLFTIKIFDINKIFNSRILLLIIFELINLYIWRCYSSIFKRLKDSLNKKGYSLFFKYNILHVIVYITHFFILIMPIPKIVFKLPLTNILIEIYFILFFVLIVVVYPFAAMIPYTYSRHYKNKIGNFFNNLSQKRIDLNSMCSIIKDSDKLNVFLKPCPNLMLDDINGENIIKNLTKLKNKNINLYMKMKLTVKEQNNIPFWDLGSICIALVPIISTLFSHNFFVDIINTFIHNKGDNVNKIKATTEALVGIFFIIIFASLIKVGIKETNKNYYERMVMYFDEVDH